MPSTVLTCDGSSRVKTPLLEDSHAPGNPNVNKSDLTIETTLPPFKKEENPNIAD